MASPMLTSLLIGKAATHAARHCSDCFRVRTTNCIEPFGMQGILWRTTSDDFDPPPTMSSDRNDGVQSDTRDARTFNLPGSTRVFQFYESR